MSAPKNPAKHRARESTPRRRRRSMSLRERTLDLVRTGRLPAFLLSVGLGVILFAFAVSDDFRVDTVVIRGNTIAYADSIVERSDAIGRSIFRVDTNEIANRVASHPAVATARIRAELPDRVIVEVTEREPAIVWQTGDQVVLVDEYGWVLAHGEADHVPRVVELEGSLPQPGAQIDPRKVAAAAFLLGELGSSSVLEFDEIDGFVVHLADDERVVMLGDPEDLPVKITALDAVRDMDVEWTRLDVRDPERPVYQ